MTEMSNLYFCLYHKLNDFIVLEPGYYEDGSFGVRIESILLLKPVTLEASVCYACVRLIDYCLLLTTCIASFRTEQL